MREARTARLLRTPGRRSGGPQTPKGQEKALANLQPFQEEKQLSEIEEGTRKRKFNGRELHGVYTIELSQPGTRELAQQIQNQLEADGAAWIRQSDTLSIHLLALCLRRIKQADAHIDKVGSLTNQKGEVRPVLDLMVKLIKEAQSLADKLGLTPQSRVKLGLNTTRAAGLAAFLADDKGGQDNGSSSDEN